MVVEPIKNKTKLYSLIEYLENNNGRDAMLFRIGINSALRISDLLTLRYCDIFDEKDKPLEYLALFEKKNGKQKKIKLNPKLHILIKDYTKRYELGESDWLFFSMHNSNNHIDRFTAYKRLKDAAEICGISHFGTHSMRKTFGYWHYKKYQNIALLQMMFNHESQADTIRYIGLNQETMDEAYQSFYL